MKPPANADGLHRPVIQSLCKQLFGKPHGGEGYIPASLCKALFEDGLHLVAGIKNNSCK